MLPRWQFVDGRVVPGVREIAADVSALHPLALAEFMSRPNVDLLIDDEPVTPAH